MLLSRCLFYRLRARLRALFGGQRLERELNDELRFHLDEQASEYLKQGMSSEEAVRAARAALGNVPLLREDVRAVWRWRWFDQLVQDVRCGTRALTRSRGFAGMSVATLALTIGATTAIFSVVWGILLRPLPVAEPERLFVLVGVAVAQDVSVGARCQPDVFNRYSFSTPTSATSTSWPDFQSVLYYNNYAATFLTLLFNEDSDTVISSAGYTRFVQMRAGLLPGKRYELWVGCIASAADFRLLINLGDVEMLTGHGTVSSLAPFNVDAQLAYLERESIMRERLTELVR